MLHFTRLSRRIVKSILTLSLFVLMSPNAQAQYNCDVYVFGHINLNNPPTMSVRNLTLTGSGSNCSVTLSPSNFITYLSDDQQPNSALNLSLNRYNFTPGTYYVTVTATDGCGESTSRTAILTVNSCPIPPVAVCNNITIPADNNCQAQVFAQAFNGGSYDPNGSIVSQSIYPTGPFGIGTHQVTYTVTDNSGLTNSCTATLTVSDQNGPAIVTTNPTIALDANGQASITSADVVSSAIDNCDGPVSNLTLSKSSFDCSDLVANIGNATSGVINGTLTADNEFEVYISTDDNVQGTLVGSGNNWASVYNMTATTLNPAQKYYIHVKATDWGGPEFFAGKFTLSGGFQFANGTQSLNTNNADWKVSSTGWGNYGTPFVVGQAGQQLQIWGNGVNTLSPAYLIWSGDWNTTGGETRYFTAEINPIIPGTNVTVTGSDAAGNVTNVTASVTLVDNMAPVASINSAVSLTLDANGTATLSMSDVDAGSYDNCGITSATLSRTSFNCNDAGSTFPVTLTLTDASGNTTTATCQVTINPTPAVIANDDSFSVNAGQAIIITEAQLTGNDVDPLGMSLQVDAVGAASAGTFVDNYNGTFTFTPAGTSNQTVTATYVVKRDDGTISYSGNGHFYEFVSSPGISWNAAKVAAEGMTYNGMQGYLATITSASEDAFVAQKLQGEGWFGASDAQTEGVWKWVTGPEAGTQFWQTTYTYGFFGIRYINGGYAVNGEYNHWAGGEPNDAGGVEDWAHYWTNGLWNDYPVQTGSISGYIVEYGGMPGDCNTASTSTATITFNVIDNIPPVVNTQNIVVGLDANGQVSITPSQVNNGTTDASGIASLSLDVSSFNCNNLGQNTVTLTAVDNNGNSATGTAIVTVEDNINPTAVAVPTLTVNLDLTASASISVSDVEAGSTDNCGIANSSIDISSFDCTDVGAPVAVTLTVVDASGNASSATTMVTVIDVQPIVANDDQFTINGNQSYTFSAAQLTANDVDPYSQPLQVDAVNSASAGTIVDNLNGTFTYTPASTGNQTVTATYVVKRDDGTIANSANGHFYEFVTSPAITWSAAKVAAEGMTYNGMQGYLATVTSAQENGFVAQKLQGEGWIGASDAETEGVWKWVTGPEAGTHFWQTNYAYSWYGGRYISSNYPINGEYNNWSSGEPNDYGSGEDYAHYWSFGLWNDYPHYHPNISGFIVEYGGMPGDCNTSSISTATITFNIIDVTPPTVQTQNATVYVDASGNASVSAQDINNGSSDPSGIASMTLDVSSFDCSDLGANTVNLTVTDVNGNAASGSATVTVLDNIAPTATFTGGNFSLTANRTVTLDPAAMVSNVSDNCGNVTLTVVGRSVYDCNDVGGTFPISVQLTDASGNSTTVSGTVAINDNNSACNNPPVAVCTPGSVPANTNCEALVLAQAFNGGSYDPDGDPITLSITPAGPFGLGTHTIVFTVTDDEGASSSCTTTLTVSDQTGPVVVPQNITVALDASGQAIITANDVVASATDNCSNVTLSIDQSQFDCNSVPAVNGTGGPGVLSSTLTVDNLFDFYISTDDNVQGTYVGSGSNWSIPYNFTSNLAAGQTYYIHVKATDVGGPEMFLGKFQLSGGFEFANGTQSLTTNIADWKVSATGWNNYTNPLYLGNIGFGPWGYGLYSMSPAQFIWHGAYSTYGGETKYFSAPIYPTSTGSNVTITATDAAGNTTTATATVDVIDNMAPVASVQGITVALDANGQASITAADIDNNSSDNCGITSYSLDVYNFSCADAGTTIPVTMTVTDASGNSSSATASVSVIDNIAPTAVANSGLVVQLDANGNGTLTAADVDGGSSDNCGIVSTSIDVTSFDCSNVGANTVILTVVDAAGNAHSASTSVQVVDQVAPTVVTNSNVVVQLDANGAGSLTAADVDGGSYDNCGVASTSINVTSFNCANVGSVPVTLTVTDVNGNVSTAVVNVTVEDNVAPSVICQNFSIDLPVNADAVITAANIDNGSSDACGIASMTVSPSSFDCSNVGDNVVTLTVTDVNGNVSTCTAIVTVNKSPLVVADVLTDFNGYNVSCNGGSNGAIDLTVSGACMPYSYSWSTGATTEDVSGLSAGTYSVVITDGGGQTYNYSYTLTEPTALSATNAMMPYTMVSGQADSTIFLGYGPQSTTLSVSASGGVAGYTYSWAPATGLSSTTGASVVASPTVTTTYTATITDANGCVMTKSITVKVLDVRDPNNPNKIVLCHLRRKKNNQTWHTLSVSINAVPAHLGHGDILGPCEDGSKVEQAVSLTAEDVHALLYPNPSAGASTLSVELHEEEEVRIALFDYSGALIDIIHEGTLVPEYEHHFDVDASQLPAGMYTVVIYTTDGTQSLRWVVVR